MYESISISSKILQQIRVRFWEYLRNKYLSELKVQDLSIREKLRDLRDTKNFSNYN